MIFGPFPVFFIERLRAIIEGAGGLIKVYSSEEAHEKLRDANRDRRGTQFQETPMQADLLYVEFDAQYIPLAQPELEKMGVVFGDHDAPELQGTEYHCLQCDHTSDSIGLCPEHKTPLLEFSDWVKAKNKGADATPMIWLAFLAVAALAIYAFVSQLGSAP